MSLRIWLYLGAAAAIIGGGLYVHHAIYESGYAASEAHWKPLFAAAVRERDAANRHAASVEAASKDLSDQSEKRHVETVASLNLRAVATDQRIRALSVRLAAARSRHCEMPEAPGTAAVPDDTAASAARADGAGASIGDTGRRCELDAASKLEWQRFYTEVRSTINGE
jgi:hypothetical protein